MNRIKIAAALFGILVTFVAASKDANATMLAIERDDFNVQRTLSQPFESARKKAWSDVTAGHVTGGSANTPPADTTQRRATAQKAARANSWRPVDTTVVDDKPSGGAKQSILSRVLKDVEGDRNTDAILPDRERPDQTRNAAAALKAELQEKLIQEQAIQKKTAPDPFDSRQIIALGTLPSITQTQGAGISTFDGLMSGDGWASFIASDYFKRAKRTIVSSETRILTTIASLTGRENRTANDKTSRSGSKGGLLLGLASALLLLIIVVVAATPRHS